MLTKEIVKEFNVRQCDRLAYLEVEEKRLLSLWKKIVEAKKNPDDFVVNDGYDNEDDENPKEGISAFEYFRTYPEALKEALKIYDEALREDPNEASRFILDNEDFQEVSVLSRRYFALLYKNCKRADTIDGGLDSPEIENQTRIEENTKRYLKDPNVDVIFEGQVTVNGLRARFDVLVRDGDKFRLYEVKGSGSVTNKNGTALKPNYLYDLGFQYYVYKSANLPLKSLGFVHLNKDFYLTEEAYPPEDKDVKNLFVILEYLNEKDDNIIFLKDYYDQKKYINHTHGREDIEIYINRLLAIQASGMEPAVKLQYYCRKGGLCPLVNECFGPLPNNHILKLTCNNGGGGVWQSSRALIKGGTEFMEDIPLKDLEAKYPKLKHSDELNINKRSMARLQIDYVKGAFEHKHHLEIKALQELLDRDYSVFPLIFFDFESFNYPVPLVNKSHPWQQICCQYSMHVVQKDYDLSKHDFNKGKGGGITHYEFLGDPLVDGFKNPEEDLITTLKAQLEDAGVDWKKKQYRVVVYNQNFEKNRLKEMAAQFPEDADFLNAFNDCVVDLYFFFVWGYWYHKDFHGSVSLKTTQPTLIKDEVIQSWYQKIPDFKETLNYKTGIIQNGGVALDTYKTMLRTAHRHNADPVLFEKLKESLLHYCKIDSWGTVILYDIIYQTLSRLKKNELDIDAEVNDNLVSSLYGD